MEEKNEKQEEQTEQEKEIEIEIEQEFNSLDNKIKNEIVFALEKKYKKQLTEFKEDYHKYMVSGRFVTGTNLREIKRGDLAVFLNLETDVTVIEKIKQTDGVTLITRNY